MAKQDYPITNLMASAKYASVYSTTGDNGSVLLLPHGCPELMKYTKPTEMEYSITGINKNSIDPVTIPLQSVYKDPTTNVRIVTHVPRANMDLGAANPRASVGGLTDEVYIQMHYNPNTGAGAGANVHVINFNTQTLEGVGNADKAFVFRKPMRFVMSSGILVANPGSETGELLIGYPFSAVSTSQSTEQMVVKLRCYLGAGVYRPENVLILPNIAFEGLDHDDACVKEENFVKVTTSGINGTFIDGAPTPFDTADKAAAGFKNLLSKPVVDMYEVTEWLTTYEKAVKVDSGDTTKRDLKGLGGLEKAIEYTHDKKTFTFKQNDDIHARIYRGFSTKGAGGTTIMTSNAGHLGEIDSLEHCNKVWGTAGGQIYKQRTILNTMKST